MQKAIVYRAYNGMEIIDARPEAEIAYENMRYAEELYANAADRTFRMIRVGMQLK